MEDNIVKSEDVTNKNESESKQVKKQAAPKIRKVQNDRTENEELPVAPDGYKFIYYTSGAGYITPTGYKFSEDQRIHLISEDEANHLLNFPNFRLPDILELIEYAKEV